MPMSIVRNFIHRTAHRLVMVLMVEMVSYLGPYSRYGNETKRYGVLYMETILHHLGVFGLYDLGFYQKTVFTRKLILTQNVFEQKTDFNRKRILTESLFYQITDFNRKPIFPENRFQQKTASTSRWCKIVSMYR